MQPDYFIELIPVFLLVCVFLAIEIGRRAGARAIRDSEEVPRGVHAIEGAVFALLGLLMAFTFSGAMQRFDARRMLVLNEANVIRTAWLRISILPEEQQPHLRDLFRQYVDSRLNVYGKLSDIDTAKKEMAVSSALQIQIWNEATRVYKSSGSTHGPAMLLSALNEMIDISVARAMQVQFHPPRIIYLMLIALVLLAAALTGHSMAGKRRRWLHIIGFAIAIAMTIYTIIDIEYPRMGLIRIDAVDQVLMDLRNTMK